MYNRKYNAPIIYVAPFELKVDIFIGLRFLIQDGGTVTLSLNHMTLSRKTIQTPIIGLKKISQGKNISLPSNSKIGKDIQDNCKCKIKGACKTYSLMCEETEVRICQELEYIENYTYDIKEDDNMLFLENLNFNCIAQEGKIEVLNSGNEEINRIIDKLAHEGIIGEEPTKHWIRNKEYCELEILYPEMIIKEEAQPPGNKDRKEFEYHIKKLLDLGCI